MALAMLFRGGASYNAVPAACVCISNDYACRQKKLT